MPRHAARTDANHADIVATFRSLFCSVSDTSAVGSGFPDLVVGCAGRNHLVEVKDGDKSPSRRRLTPDQQEFHRSWVGSVNIVESVADVEQLVAIWRRT